MNFLKSFFKWTLKILAAIMVIAVAVLIIFRISIALRENKNFTDAAPKDGKFITTTLGKIYIQETGPENGPAIIFIHGFGAWSKTWQPAMQSASLLGYHSVAIDMPPFGFSEKPLDNSFSRENQTQRIKEVLDTLNIKSAVFVGHSIGGRATMEFVLEHPEYVKALVLVDPALGFDKNNNFVQNNPPFLVKTLFANRTIRNALIASTATNPLLTKTLLANLIVDAKILTPERLKIYQEPFVVKNSTNVLGDWLKFLVEGVDNSISANAQNYKQIKSPALIIWGDKDTVTPLWQGQNLNSLILNSKLVTLSNIGNIHQIEDSNKFNQTLTDFLKTLK